MTYNADPADILSWFEDMRAYWCEAELDALYGLSLAQTRTSPMSAKIRRRIDHRLSQHLSRTTSRAAELRKYLAAGLGPTDLITDILRRIANAEAGWRQLLAIARAAPVVPDVPDPRRAISSPDDLPAWLLKLQEWAEPESEIIADLEHAIATKQPKADEAMDHVEWTAEDDLEAISLVLRLSHDWDLEPSTRAHLVDVSDAARTELERLIAVVNRARPYSFEMIIATELAAAAKASGEKPN